MTNLFNYIDRPSPVHKLTGASKLICFLLWSLASMITYDTRLLLSMMVLSFILFKVSKIKLKDVSALLWFSLIFALLNNITVYLFSPEYGVEVYGTRHLIFRIAGRYTVTLEQLFYQLNLLLKYLTLMPIMLLFVSTTNPSEFAASLSKIGVSYKISYSVALAMRYIPDIQMNYHDISQAQQARGIEMSKKESLVKRLKAISNILIPLILSSMDRIDIISDAMELRSFGKKEKRTWYRERKFSKWDIISMILFALLFALSVSLILINDSRYFNPFTP